MGFNFEKDLWLCVRRQVQQTVGRVPGTTVSPISLGRWRFSVPRIPGGPELNKAVRVRLEIEAPDPFTAKAVGWHWILVVLWGVRDMTPMITKVRDRRVEPWEGDVWAMAANLAGARARKKAEDLAKCLAREKDWKDRARERESK